MLDMRAPPQPPSIFSAAAGAMAAYHARTAMNKMASSGDAVTAGAVIGIAVIVAVEAKNGAIATTEVAGSKRTASHSNLPRNRDHADGAMAAFLSRKRFHSKTGAMTVRQVIGAPMTGDAIDATMTGAITTGAIVTKAADGRVVGCKFSPKLSLSRKQFHSPRHADGAMAA